MFSKIKISFWTLRPCWASIFVGLTLLGAASAEVITHDQWRIFVPLEVKNRELIQDNNNLILQVQTPSHIIALSQYRNIDLNPSANRLLATLGVLPEGINTRNIRLANGAVATIRETVIEQSGLSLQASVVVARKGPVQALMMIVQLPYDAPALDIDKMLREAEFGRYPPETKATLPSLPTN